VPGLLERVCFQAKIVSKSAEEVTLERKDGKNFTLKISRFSKGDQSFIKKWKAPTGAAPSKESGEVRVHPNPPRISLAFASNKRIEKTNISVDDKKMSVAPMVRIENLERGKDLKGFKVNVFSFGRSVANRKELKVFSRDDFKTDIDFGEPVELAGERRRMMYDNRGYATYGHSYLGHLVIVRDSENRIVLVDASPSSLGEDPIAALSMKENKLIYRD